MIVRGKQTIIRDGSTRLLAGDLMVLAARAFEDRENLSLHEMNVERGNRWAKCALSEIFLQDGRLVVLIKRGAETMIPTGRTVIEPGDILVLAESTTDHEVQKA